MDLSKQNILFIGRATQMAGTENVILQLCEILKPCVNKIVVCTASGFNQKALKAMGIPFYEIPDIENKNPKTILAVSRTIRRIVHEENITVIHTHHRMAAFYVTMLGLYKHCVFINTSHNTFDDKVALTRFAYKHAHLIACGEMVKKNLEEVFSLQGVTAIHNAVKPFEGPLVKDPLLSELHKKGCFVIGNVGRFSEQKGFVYFIQAMPAVLAKHPKVRFVLVGDGEKRTELESLVHALKLDAFVSFMGFRKDVQNLMSQMDLVVLSSLWEGLPLTPIEAFSVGRTVVATAVDGTPEIVKDGVNGMLTPAGNSESLAQKINELMAADIHEYEKKAYSTYVHEFSFDVFNNAILNYYRGL